MIMKFYKEAEETDEISEIIRIFSGKSICTWIQLREVSISRSLS